MLSSPPRFKRLFLIVLGLGLAGCIDPIDLDVGDPVAFLVVDGQVAEGPGPHTVILSRPGSFTQGIDALRPRVSGALVVVEVGDGAEVVFPEIGSGRYVAQEGELVGVVGETYRLRVTLPNGTEYASPEIEMLPAPEMLSLDAEIVDGVRLIGDVLVDDPRVQLTVDTETHPDDPTYLRWRWSGVHSVMACWPWNSPNMECNRCYVETDSPSLVEIADDAMATGNVLLGQPASVLPIHLFGSRFVPAYYFRMEQQALTPEAYGYLSLIRDMRDNVGSLFDPPAEAVTGNMRNVGDPLDRALGYFTVVGTSTDEICVRRDDFPDFPTIPGPNAVNGRCGIEVAGSPTPPPGFVEACARDNR